MMSPYDELKAAARTLRQVGHSNIPDNVSCLDEDDKCSGAVVLRPSLSGTGVQIPRCGYHWDKRLQDDQRHREIYPDSSIPPDWFDPTLAGERWDEDY